MTSSEITSGTRLISTEDNAKRTRVGDLKGENFKKILMLVGSKINFNFTMMRRGLVVTAVVLTVSSACRW